jgi:protoporphyrin/coproporphyrin ferrochelatase
MKGKTGVILLNMGGPEKPADVAPFLYNLFSDRDIIRLGPRFLQKPLAWIIARKRTPKSLQTYKKIGGGSPLIKITNRQAQALQDALAGDDEYVVTTAMRYWQPTASDALDYMAEQGIDNIIALPLYPHFSRATSGSSLADLRRAAAAGRRDVVIKEIHGWPDSPLYVKCFADNIQKGLASFTTGKVEVVYSAHSLPTSFIAEGDPYLDQLHMTIAAIEKITGKTGKLCFQSRSGPVEWLSPSTPETLEQLAAEGCTKILMVPISFVSDHVETLYEINMLYRGMAAEKGIDCRPCESLNTNPLFIQALKELVLKAAATFS